MTVRVEPPVTETSAPFWAATRDQHLVLQWCRDCDRPIWFPREVCPRCMGSALEWRPSDGRGVVYAVTTEHSPQNPAMAPLAPYTVVLVDLDDGVRMLSSVVGSPPESVTIGAAVDVTWEPLSDGRHLPMFELRGI